MKCLLCTLLALLAIPAAAQDYPAKNVRIMVPFAAGGSTDVLARMVAQRLNESYGQLFIVENRPGATGTIASAFVAKSPPDGYTLIMHSVSTYMAGFLYRKLNYDAAKAFAPIINCTVNPFYLVSASTLPVKNVADLIALARRRPNELTYATVGMGSGAHLVTEMFNAAAGIKTVAVAYKGSVPAMIALASGETVFAINNILDAQPYVKQGKMRALAVTGAKRSPAVPDVPTLLESGIPVEVNLWTGMFAPEGTPRAVVAKLNEDVRRIVDTPQMKEWLLKNLGGEFTPHTPDQFSSFLAADAARWQKTIKEIGLQLD
ncbi:MAG TPA: tripartite tricarboxylate transporter substrate binding protein [Burkholderiales bacterium]|nr:tripartite tricarboxylate transporter substrate binding protein [Burkholderiales bacterium]